MATEKRLIDVNEFKVFLEGVRQDYIEENTFSSDFAANVIETVQDNYLDLAPTVDAVEVVHGRWEHDSIGFSDFWVCSACREAWFFEEDPVNESTRVNYCPNCGAKMDGDGNG